MSLTIPGWWRDATSNDRRPNSDQPSDGLLAVALQPNCSVSELGTLPSSLRMWQSAYLGLDQMDDSGAIEIDLRGDGHDEELRPWRVLSSLATTDDWRSSGHRGVFLSSHWQLERSPAPGKLTLRLRHDPHSAEVLFGVANPWLERDRILNGSPTLSEAFLSSGPTHFPEPLADLFVAERRRRPTSAFFAALQDKAITFADADPISQLRHTMELARLSCRDAELELAIDGVHLKWTDASHSSTTRHAANRARAISRCFAAVADEDRLKSLISLWFGADLTADLLQDSISLWHKMVARLADDPLGSRCHLDQMVAIEPEFLFWEWTLRSRCRSSWHLSNLQAPVPRTDVGSDRAFEEFQHLVQHQELVLISLIDQPGICSLVPSTLRNLQRVHDLQTQAPGTDQTTDDRHEAAQQAKGARSPPNVSIRELEEWLEKVEVRDTPLYGEYERAYLEALSEEQRSLTAEIRTRLDQSLYRRHLRQRLAQYLFDRPELWLSRHQDDRLRGIKGARMLKNSQMKSIHYIKNGGSPSQIKKNPS